MYNISCMLFAI